MTAPNKWPIGARITPLQDTLICQLPPALRTLLGPEPPHDRWVESTVETAGRCWKVFSKSALERFGQEDDARYSFRGLFEDDLIVVIASIREVGANEWFSFVGFGRAQDFELVGW